MKTIIPLQTLFDNILAELLAKAPDVKQINFSMDDGTIETATGDKYNKKTLDSLIKHIFIRLIKDDKIQLLTARGTMVLNRPETFNAIINYGVSPDDAEIIKGFCGLVEPVKRADEKPLEGSKEIAEHCSIKQRAFFDYLKKYEKFPVKKNEKGIYIAYPSELNFWLANKK